MEEENTENKYVVIKPTWEGLVLVLAETFVTTENWEAKEIARQELLKLGRFADEMNEMLAQQNFESLAE